MGTCLSCLGLGKGEMAESLLGESDIYSPAQQRGKGRNQREGGKPSEFRSFVVVKHHRHGFMLLEATKARKGRHFQLPGGRVDADDIGVYGEKEAFRVAAARELLEETGLDMRESMHRLVPVDFEAMGAKGQKVHQSRRRYFRLDINDSDSVDDIPTSTEAAKGLRLATPLSMEDFHLCLSHEHTGFKFEKEGKEAADAVSQHSGGWNRIAILLIEGIPHTL